MKKIGCVFGCFIPLHKGHISIIKKALSENDVVILGVCGFDDDRGKDFIPFRDRIDLIRKIYGNNSKVIISVVDDEKIGLTGKFDEVAWRAWSDEYFSVIPENPYCRDYDKCNAWFRWYTADKRYINVLSKEVFRYNEQHMWMWTQRKDTINISGTEIRSNPEKYQDYIDETFKKYLKEKGVLS